MEVCLMVACLIQGGSLPLIPFVAWCIGNKCFLLNGILWRCVSCIG